MDLGKSLSIALAIKGMRVMTLAAAMDIPSSSVSAWKKYGNMNQANLAIICGHLDMSVSEFVKLGEEAEA